MTSVNEKSLKKAKALSDMFERFEKSGLSTTEFCKQEGIHTSKFYYWKDRYLKNGTNGLVDKRTGVTHKITSDVKEYIRDVKKKDKQKSGIDIAKMIKKKFGTKVSVFHVQRVLKDMGLNDPVGRKPGKPIKKTSD